MADERRGAPGAPRGSQTPRASRASRPRGRSGPGRSTGTSRAAAPRTPAPTARTEEPRRPRLTGRAAILVLVLAVLAVSYASSLRAYLQQRSHIDDLKGQISERQDSIDSLEREQQRWSDPAYVRSQARERFGYVMPGETPFVVLDEDERPLDAGSRLSDPDDVAKQPPTAWYDEVWESTKVAGDPPRKVPPPPRKLIDGSGEPSGE